MPKPQTSVTPERQSHPCHTLHIVFGDQLDLDSPVLAAMDRDRDVVLMVEVAAESGRAGPQSNIAAANANAEPVRASIPSHVQRTVLFLSAMRHFAASLRERGVRVRYVTLDDPANTGCFEEEMDRAIRELQPRRVSCVRPGEWRVLEIVQSCAARAKLELDVHEDAHFLTAPDEFAAWANGRASLTMEYFYREQRRKTGYLMVGKGKAAKPEGGVWNFDASNRVPFGAGGPKPMPPTPPRFKPDAITREVIDVVSRVLPNLPGRLSSPEDFVWPVTREQALEALRAFIRDRLPRFGPYEDAMWSTSPTVYHSVLSPALNLKLLNPRECCEAAIEAFNRGRAPLQSVEAFVRQIIGWREFIRGVYWLEGPEYAERNGLDSCGTLPEFYWTGETDMNCLRTCLNQVLDTTFGHHIQRLMVTGNFALISGVHPRAVSDWYLGMYADGVDWVTLPNTLGMVMHADKRPGSSPGVTGVVGTKPYAASGKYIQKMSNYCRDCRYDPAERTGPSACPFNVFYWDFLIRHRERLASNQRMALILKGADRLSASAVTQVRIDAELLRKRLGIRTGSSV